MLYRWISLLIDSKRNSLHQPPQTPSPSLSFLLPFGNHESFLHIHAFASFLYMDYFCAVYYIPDRSDITYYLCFFFRFTSLGMRICCSNHVAANGILFFIWLCSSPLCIHTASSYHSSVVGHLGRFHIWVTVNRHAMNIGMHTSISMKILSGYMPRRGMLDHMVIPYLLIWGTSILFSIVAVTIFIPNNSLGDFPLLHTLSDIRYL